MPTIPKIYIKTWLELKPYTNSAITDAYYLKLCNKVHEALYEGDNPQDVYQLNKDEVELLACFLVSYFEDIISGTNIWNTFVQLHEKMYKTKLPFYNCSNYDDGEINEGDIQFLTWYFINNLNSNAFLNPVNVTVMLKSETIMNIFEEAYEYAPENDLLKSFYTLNDDENDYYEVRNLMGSIILDSYLFFVDTGLKWADKELDLVKMLIENKFDHITCNSIINDAYDGEKHSVFSNLLALSAKEWTAALIGNKHPLYNDILNLSPRVKAYFFYKGQDTTHLHLEHIATGRNINLLSSSYPQHKELLKQPTDTILILSMINWQKEWYLSGSCSIMAFQQKIVDDEKNSFKSKMAFNFLEKIEHPESADFLTNQYNAFLNFNNGSQIAFMPAKETDAFINKFTTHYNNSLNLTKEQEEAGNKRVENEASKIFDSANNNVNFKDADNINVIFFNSNNGVEIATEISNAFSVANNPYYDEDLSHKDCLELFFNESFSKEMVLFSIEHGKNKIPYYQSETGKYILKNIDFLLRFWKKGNYYSQAENRTLNI